ncbi:hypothetical protein J2Y69_001403 [Microbacterium resistens]|uniref:Ribosomally synthesized peptide with SipW-like signal peptide n=1 Tax=Microbacterium resistens TaxID=156977 RepID=A0ABU1SB28_9MICO|nr:hypothetical protein [Microbacterium resistens]MDR6866804.1 hypothetical protein [Microbacterium resistens]
MTETVPRRGWWRRNAIALGAVAVLAPMTIAAVGGYEWYENVFSGPASVPVDADPSGDGTIDIGGAIWGPAKGVVVTDTQGLDLPEGTVLIGVTIPVEPQHPRAEGEPAYCMAPRLVEQRSGREWLQVRAELGLPYLAEEPYDCTLQEGDPFQLVIPYVVPADAEGPFWVEVPVPSADPSFARFSIDP